MPYYKGDTGTVILYDEGNSRWRMIHDPDNGLEGLGSSSLVNMGTGVQTWSINQDICGDGVMGPVFGLLTVCKVKIIIEILVIDYLFVTFHDSKFREMNLLVTVMVNVLQWIKDVIIFQIVKISQMKMAAN